MDNENWNNENEGFSRDAGTQGPVSDESNNPMGAPGGNGDENGRSTGTLVGIILLAVLLILAAFFFYNRGQTEDVTPGDETEEQDQTEDTNGVESSVDVETEGVVQ